tara:strand:- start:3819 stop:5036 length:1218 start_codon:yes stop_codon:yes gene_type:complete
MSNRIRKAKYDNIVKLNRTLLSEENLNINNDPDVEEYIGLEEENHDHGGTPPYTKKTKGKKLNEGCGCGESKETSGHSYMAGKQLHSISNKAEDMYNKLEKDDVLDDWVESHLAKIDQMMDSVSDSFNHDKSKDMGDMGPGGCPPGQHWCNETGDCHDDHSPQTEPLTIKGMEVINLQERIGRRIMKEQNNPFSGGSGPNWDAAEAAWANWNATTQTGAPGTQDLLNTSSTFINNMAGKSCEFYQKRLTAQVNSFVNQFGGSLGADANATNVTGGQNPAWQSQKYARIMWLSDAVYDCNNPSATSSAASGTTAQSDNASCFYDWINDSTNDVILTTPVCNNGNQAISQQNLEKTKFRHQSIADCNMLDNKIAKMLHLSQTTTGCEQIRKAAKHEYLTELRQHCCN